MDLLSKYAESDSERSDSDEADLSRGDAQSSDKAQGEAGKSETMSPQIGICSALLSGDYHEGSSTDSSSKKGSQKKRLYAHMPVTHRKPKRTLLDCRGTKCSRYISKREQAYLTEADNHSEMTATTADGSTLKTVLSSPPMPIASLLSVKRKVIVNYQPSSQLIRWTNHNTAAVCANWHKPNGQLLLSCGMDGRVCIFEPFQRRTCLRQWQPHGEVAARVATWFYDGIQVLSGGYDNHARVSDAETGRVVSSFGHTSHVTAVKIHPVQRHVFLSGTSDRFIASWDVRCKKAIREYAGSVGQIQDFLFLLEGGRFVAASDMTRCNAADRAVAVWDFHAGVILSSQIYQEAYTCTSLCAHPKQSKFVAQSNAGYVAIFSSQPPFKLDRFKRFDKHEVSGFPLGCDISPDGELLYSGSADGAVYCYDFQTSHLLNKWAAHNISVAIACHPLLPNVLATTGWDGTVSVWS